jgi:cytochrome c5
MPENISQKRSALLLAGLIVAALAVASLAWSQQSPIRPLASVHAAATPNSSPADSSKSAASQAAFLRAWTVFDSPRCKNCHPAGDAPLQGDDSHIHIQNVKRGADGHGLYGMTCHTCHQDANLPGANMPPGNPKWSLPPAKTKMVIEGETPGQFCRQLKDPAKNGNRSLAQIMEHVSQDDLVGWGWNPGDGRTLPPLNRPDFVAAMQQWVDNGAACPQ